jgi:DNA-binding HxlR family transcriptional regulator
MIDRNNDDAARVCTAMADILNRIGDKWSVMVVGYLARGTMRFNALRNAIGGISQRMLTLTLRNLERDGLVTRTVYPEIPPRVEYELTPLGSTLTEPLKALWRWADEHQGEVQSARQAYDDRQSDGSERPAPQRYAGAAGQ